MPGRERFKVGGCLRHVQRQHGLTHHGLLRNLCQRGLCVHRQHQHRWRRVFSRRHHPAARHCAADHPQTRCHLLHKAHRPGHAVGAQRDRQLHVQRRGQAVKLARTGHDFQHVGDVGAGAHAVGEGFYLLHKFGVFDVVERAAAVGQLHARLQFTVAAACLQRLPGAGFGVEALDVERFGAGAARRRQMLQRQFGADGRFQRHRHDGVDQRVQPRHALVCASRRRRVVEGRRAVCIVGRAVHGRLGAFGQCAGLGGLARLRPPCRPPGLRGQHQQHQDAQDCECCAEFHRHLRAAFRPLQPLRPGSVQTSCPPRRCATHPVPASSRR